MGIAGGGKTEVTEVFGRIAGLFHTAEQDLVDHPLFRFPLGLVEQPLELTRIDALAGQPQFIAEVEDELLEILQFCQIGCLMDPIERRYVSILNMRGNSLVCGQHELLDNLVGQIALGADDSLGPPLHIEDDFRLRQIKINASSRFPLRHQFQGQSLHDLEIVLEHHDRIDRAIELSQKAVDLQPDGYNQYSLAMALYYRGSPQDLQDAFALASTAAAALPEDFQPGPGAVQVLTRYVIDRSRVTEFVDLMVFVDGRLKSAIKRDEPGSRPPQLPTPNVQPEM